MTISIIHNKFVRIAAPALFFKCKFKRRAYGSSRCRGMIRDKYEKQDIIKEMKVANIEQPNNSEILEKDINDALEENTSKGNSEEKKLGWSFPILQIFDHSDKIREFEKLRSGKEEEIPNQAIIDMISPSQGTEGPLPEVTRDQILQSCVTVSFTIFLLSFLLREFALFSPEIVGNDPDTVSSLLSLTNFSFKDCFIALAAASLVTGARFLLYRYWKDFAIATNRSNKQVLTPLSFSDCIIVSFLPGISEELLFRSGLLTAMYNDWRGVLVSGTVFGILHQGAGRNWAFSLWATAVGCFYGAIFIWTEDIYAPILAHSFSNLFSAMYWKSQYSQIKET